MNLYRGVLFLIISSLVLIGLGSQVSADRFSSSSYIIDASGIGNSAAGAQSSTSYKLTSASGESAIGSGTSGSYKLGEGYVAQLASNPTIAISVSTGTIALGSQTPGTSNSTNMTITTDVSSAPGYTLSTNQNNNLTSGGNTIPGVSGTIASPVTWVESTTKGLGFTLVSTTGTPIPAIWNSGNDYAAFPGTGTVFYTRTGVSGSASDQLVVRVKLDTLASQPNGSYSNIVTWTATTTL